MKRHALAAALLASLAGAGAANAADYRCVSTHEIDTMRAHQMQRIERGRESGQLSWREYRSLKAEQFRIAADERFAKIDGCVSPFEFRRIEQELTLASAHISNLKHNDEVAGRRRWNRWWY